MRYDCVFVGAGPATLAAANVLLQQEITSFLILEQGGAFNKRGCPGLRRSLCTHCNGDMCHVSGGEGGSSARFGNKLCYFPASSQIQEYFDSETIAASGQFLDRLLLPHFDSRLSQSDSYHELGDLDVDSCQLVKKYYESDVLLRGAFEQLIRRLLSRPRQAGLIRLDTPVDAITKMPGSGFRLLDDRGDVVAEASHVILGCGRTSHRLLPTVFTSLGVEWDDPSPDIGIRVEADSNLFTEEYTYQADPKYKHAHFRYGTSRTFCGCHGGIIVPVKFGASFYADGAFGDSLGNSSNVAFMVRSPRSTSIRDLECWCTELNGSGRGSLLLGEVVLGVRGLNQLVAAIMALVPHWPSKDHEIMFYQLLELTLGGEVSLLKRCEGEAAVARVFGPAIDRYWPRPRLTKGLQTNVPGLFVLGDVTGVSRGFVQAMVSGAAWGLTYLTELGLRHGITRSSREAEWSVLA